MKALYTFQIWRPGHSEITWSVVVINGNKTDAVKALKDAFGEIKYKLVSSTINVIVVEVPNGYGDI